MTANHDELLFLHAAGVLDDDERRRVEAHRRAMGEEGERAAAAAETALAHLALALEPVEPPVAARQSLLDRVVQERARARLWRGRRSRSGPPRALSSKRARTGAVLAASLLLALGAGFWLGRSLGEETLSLRQAEIQRLETDRGRLEIEVARRQVELRARESDYAVVQAAAAAAEQLHQKSLEGQLVLARESRAEIERLRADAERMSGTQREEVRALQAQIADRKRETLLLEARHDAVAARAEQSRSERSLLELELARARSIISLLGRDELARLTLVASPSKTTARAELLWELEDRLCYMRAWRLPPLHTEHRYALWVVDEAGSVGLIGTFAPDASGEAELFSDLPMGEGRLADIYVTLEQTPVDSGPLGPKVMTLSSQGDGKRTRRDPYDRRSRHDKRRF